MPASAILSLAVVSVQLIVPAEFPAKTLRVAEERAVRMLASAHANLVFAGSADLQVQITPDGFRSMDAMGFATLSPDSRWASVSWPAVQCAANQMDADPGVLLGAVLAHEIGHLLFGSAHTYGGVMSPHLGLREMKDAGQGTLIFLGADARRLTFPSSPARATLRPASHP